MEHKVAKCTYIYSARSKLLHTPLYLIREYKKIHNHFFSSRELAQTSPYYESLKKQDVEVLFCYEMYDELVLLELKQYGGRQLVSAENDMQKEAVDSAEPLIGGYLLICLCVPLLGYVNEDINKLRIINSLISTLLVNYSVTLHSHKKILYLFII